MASSSALVLLLLLLFSAACCLDAAEAEPKVGGAAGNNKEEDDVVARTCAKATSNFCHIHLKNKYCVSTLRSDTRSARAQEPHDLAVVAIDLARRGAAAADAKAAALLERETTPEAAARVLRYCRSDYAAVARLGAMCRGMVEAYSMLGEDAKRDPKRMDFYYSEECSTKLMAAAKNCAHVALFAFEQVLDEALQREFIDVARRAALAKAMVEVVIGVTDPFHEFGDEFDFVDE